MKPITHTLRHLFTLTIVCLLMSCAAVPSKTSSPGTLHQVGFVWLKNPADRAKVIRAVHDFGREIPEVKSVSVGQPFLLDSKLADTSYDVAFALTFENEAAHKRYGAHPVHVKAAQEVFLPLSRKLLFYHYLAE